MRKKKQEEDKHWTLLQNKYTFICKNNIYNKTSRNGFTIQILSLNDNWCKKMKIKLQRVPQNKRKVELLGKDLSRETILFERKIPNYQSNY